MKTKISICISSLLALTLLLLSLGAGLKPVSASPLLQETPQAPPGFVVSTPSADGSIHHIVKEGDFPYTIVEAYGISLQELIALNALDANPILQVGQDLLIRKPGSVTMPTATLSPEEEAMRAAASAVPPTPDVPALLAGTATAQIQTQFAGQIGPGTPYPSATATHGPGVFNRIFSSQARYLGLAVIGIVVFGLILLVISARKMQQ